MVNIKSEISVSKSKLQDLMSTIVNAEKELESLKIDLHSVKSEHKKSRNGLDSLKNTFDVFRKESLLVGDKLMLLSDETLLTRNEVYVHKKEKCIFRNDLLQAVNDRNMLKSKIRKDVRSVKSVLESSKNKLYDAKKGIDTFKVNFQNRKKERVNLIITQIHKSNENINAISVNSINLHKKSTNSTKISELKRLKSEIERCRNETMRYTVRNKKCMDDLRKLLDSSNATICNSINEENTEVISSDNKPCNNSDNELCNNSDNEPCNNSDIEPCNSEPCNDDDSDDDADGYSTCSDDYDDFSDSDNDGDNDNDETHSKYDEIEKLRNLSGKSYMSKYIRVIKSRKCTSKINLYPLKNAADQFDIVYRKLLNDLTHVKRVQLDDLSLTQYIDNCDTSKKVNILGKIIKSQNDLFDSRHNMLTKNIKANHVKKMNDIYKYSNKLNNAVNINRLNISNIESHAKKMLSDIDKRFKPVRSGLGAKKDISEEEIIALTNQITNHHNQIIRIDDLK